jgi:hypothetical protein
MVIVGRSNYPPQPQRGGMKLGVPLWSQAMPPRRGWGGSFRGEFFYNQAAPNGAKGGVLNLLNYLTILITPPGTRGI